MSKGPDGQERPGDAIGCAVKVAKLATGEITEESHTDRQNVAQKGGRARALKLSPERRKEIAKNGAAKRWGVPTK